MHNIVKTIGIDWSGARGAAHARSIGWASLDLEKSDRIDLETKPLSRMDVTNRLLDETTKSGITVAGVDANFSIANSMLERLCGVNACAQDLWRAVEDICQTDNTLCGTDFALAHPDFFWMSGKKPAHMPDPLPRRQTEIACANAGLGYPESPFKMIGPKQVGKGGLAAMRLAQHLKKQAGDAVTIWPFENITSGTRLIVGEIYPRLFWRQASFGGAKIREIDKINQGLSWYQATNLKAHQALSDHQSDAVISAAGLAWMIRQRGIGAFDGAPLPPLASNEGWIMGLRATI